MNLGPPAPATLTLSLAPLSPSSSCTSLLLLQVWHALPLTSLWLIISPPWVSIQRASNKRDRSSLSTPQEPLPISVCLCDKQASLTIPSVLQQQAHERSCYLLNQIPLVIALVFPQMSQSIEVSVLSLWPCRELEEL